MIPTWQMDAYERLRTEIVRSAVKDLEKAYRKSDRLGAVCSEQRKLERWFKSPWGQLLCGDNGEYILDKVRQNYKASVNSKCKLGVPDDVQKRIYEEYINGARYKAITQRYGITSATLYNIVRRWGK